MSTRFSKLFHPSILVGIAGLLVVGWGLYPYIKDLGFDATKQPSQAAASVQGDFSQVGQSGQTKNLIVVVATSSVTKAGVVLAVATAQPIPDPVLPFQAPPFNPAGWIYDWGSASIASGALNFGAATSSTGGDLFLASSSSWTNYAVEANMDWLAGESFGIIARFADTKDFVYCDFGDQTAQIVLRENGTDSVISQSNILDAGVGAVQNLGVSVYGNNVGCTVNGNEVLGAAIAQGDPAHGGVGLISWDPTLGVSRIVINALTATALTANNIATPFPAPASVAAASATAATSSLNTAVTSTVAVVPAKKLEIPYSETNFTNDVNWQRTWGVMATDTLNAMDVESAADTSGGSVILANTDNWINYRVSATLDWTKGETFMLIGRYVDPSDYVACNFVRDPNNSGSVMIELEKFVNGNEATLQTGEDTNFPHEGDANIAVSLSLQDTQATCLFDGHSVSNAGSGSYGVSPVAGTVGFSTWDPTLGNTEIVVKSVSVASNY